jgi:hypothetical protein
VTINVPNVLCPGHDDVIVGIGEDVLRVDMPEPAADMPMNDVLLGWEDVLRPDIPEWGDFLPQDNRAPALMSKPTPDKPRGGTYKLLDDEKSVVYVGRTNDLERREGEHGRGDKGEYKFRIDRRTDDYAEQRGREQKLYDRYHPPLNKRQPISPKNPKRDYYLNKAK